MTAAATKRPFADAQPSELREAILDEDRPEFDRQYLHAMQVATSTLRLDELTAFLEHWRLTAWAQTANGHDAYRAMLTKADRILATGQPEPGSRPWDEVKAELGL